MKKTLTQFIIPILLILSGCSDSSSREKKETSPSVSVDESVYSIPSKLSGIALASTDYTLIDPDVRSALSKAGHNFIVPVRNGSYSFPASVLMGQYRTVTVDTENISYGDLTGDGIPDAVTRVKIGSDAFERVELAAFTSSGGIAHQFASFPLGRATIRTVEIVAGKIRVNFTHTVLGDPGPRNTELLLEI